MWDGVKWTGYSDAKPSEAIQKHDLPGIAVAVIFPHHPNGKDLDVPIKQYKDCRQKNKGQNAQKLAQWLKCQKKLGLILNGFVIADTQISAAKFGLDFVEELPRTHVEKHFDQYRLWFWDDHIDFSQAIALLYYYFAISLGILKAGTKLSNEKRRLFLAMDRFPGEPAGSTVPGESMPETIGFRFMEYVRQHSETGSGIVKQNSNIGLNSQFTTLDWWKKNTSSDWKKGKTHPHFILPDWLAAASLANAFRGEYIASYGKHSEGVAAADALEELYSAFRQFELWSMEPNVLNFIKSGTKLWAVPDDARSFIISRAEK